MDAPCETLCNSRTDATWAAGYPCYLAEELLSHLPNLHMEPNGMGGFVSVRSIYEVVFAKGDERISVIEQLKRRDCIDHSG